MEKKALELHEFIKNMSMETGSSASSVEDLDEFNARIEREKEAEKKAQKDLENADRVTKHDPY